MKTEETALLNDPRLFQLGAGVAARVDNDCVILTSGFGNRHQITMSTDTVCAFLDFLANHSNYPGQAQVAAVGRPK